MKRIHYLVTLLSALSLLPSKANAQMPATNKLPVIIRPAFGKDTFNITKYGAVADGITLNTKSINLAIQACSGKGGGVVLIPQGLWLTGPIELKSNVNLHLQRGALVEFSKDFNQYPLVATNYEGVAAYRCQSPVSGRNLNNIAITGDGIIDGGGDAWHTVSKDRHSEREWNAIVASGGVVGQNGQTWYPSEKSLKGTQTRGAGIIREGMSVKDLEGIKDFLRPNMISLTSCKKVLLEGVTFQNSPAWNIHPLLCEQLTLEHVTVKNEWYAPNGDGIDLESCRYALIENSSFSTGDDGICIKSGRDEQGRKRGVPTENVIVRNCTVYRAHGGFVIGSEMSGGARNIYVSNCTFIGTDIGLRFKTTRGRGGIVENIYISDIHMKEIVNDAIFFDMYYGIKTSAGAKDTSTKFDETTPRFRNIYVKNITCDGARRGVFIRGLPEMQIAGIHFDNLTLKTNEGMVITEAENISFNNVRLVTNNKQPLVNITNAESIRMAGFHYTADSQNKTIFDINGQKTKGISISKTDYKKDEANTSFGDGAGSGSLEVR